MDVARRLRKCEILVFEDERAGPLALLVEATQQCEQPGADPGEPKVFSRRRVGDPVQQPAYAIVECLRTAIPSAFLSCDSSTRWYPVRGGPRLDRTGVTEPLQT